jgi:hemolysin activation/secretion protein
MSERPENAIRCLGRWRRYGALVGAVACALALLLATAGPGQAQQPAQQARPDPLQTEKRFDAFQAEQRRVDKPAIAMPRMARPEIRADTRPLFKLTAVGVEGASVISGAAIAGTYRPYIGRTVSQADLAEIAVKVSDLYRDAGYHLSRAIVPPQELKNGRVRLKVIEGAIVDIALTGKGAEQFGIGSLLRPITEEQPSRLKTLERQLLLVNERPGVRITDTALEEIGAGSGRFRLVVSVETWHIYTALALDNLGTPAVGTLQAYSASAFNSYLVKGDSLGVNLSTVPDTPRELGFARLSYDAPIGHDGVRLGATALYSEIWPGDYRREIRTRSQFETYELKASFVPIETRRSSFWLTAAAGFSDVSERDSFGLTYRDHIRTVSLTADYKLQDKLDGWNYLTVIWRQGLDVLGASRKDDVLLSRYGASGDFSVIDFSYTRYQTLSDIWSLKISASAQWASAPLLTSQQFYLGDAAYGPGYYSGDNGFAGLLELRFDQSLPGKLLKGYQLYGFVDGGAVWNVDSPGDVLSLSSAGAGVRFFLADQFQAGLAVAVPFHPGTTFNGVRDTRVLFSLSKAFKLCPDRPQLSCI